MQILNFFVVAAGFSAFFLAIATTSAVVSSSVHGHFVSRPAIQFVQ